MQIGLTTVMPARGTLPMELHPVAATQSLKTGDFVYLVSGKVTKCAAASASITTATGIWGVMAQDATLLATNSLVAVHILGPEDLLVLPSYGAAPTLAIIGNGANTTGYVIYNDAGVYKIDLSTAAAAVVRPRNLEFTDGRDSTGRLFKATFSVGDRVICKLLVAARQF